MEPITLGGMEFYRLCVRMKENEEIVRRFQEQMNARQAAALTEAGLDPAKTYRLDEKTFAATEVVPNGV